MGNLTAEDQIDHVVMRKWLAEFVSQLDTLPRTKRRRPEAAISIQDVPMKYNETEEFAIRVYTPTEPSSSPDSLRPVVIMIHGGGWMLGVTKADDGKNFLSNAHLKRNIKLIVDQLRRVSSRPNSMQLLLVLIID